MRRTGLTALEVSRRSKIPGTHWTSDRLYLLVSDNLRASWIYRYQDNFAKHDHGLGPYPAVPLAEARNSRDECDRLRRAGGDPIEARRSRRMQARLEAAKEITFRQSAESYIASHKAGWRNPRHAAQWPSTLEAYVYPIFGGLPVQAIDVGLVMKAIEPIWTVKPETAGRVRGRIEAVLDWAAARGYRQGENPARWRGHLENLLPKRSKVRRVEHHAALPYAELPEFMTELRPQEGIAARALEFAILTAARTGEVIGARWPEIDGGARLWVVPAERMKANREHRVPLNAAAAAILDGMKAIRQDDWVFPGGRTGRPISNKAFLMLLRRMGRGDLTAHGFRSTFSDWCAERTTFPREVREAALSHVIGDRVEAAYRRSDLFERRRQLAEAWGRFCMTPPAGDTVVPIRRAK